MVVDKQLIADCKEFDNRAQSELYNKYSSLMFGICLRYCQSYEEAEDLLQEGFITIYAKIGQYSGEGSFLGWMRRVMINTVLMSFRKKANDKHMLEIDGINELKIVTDHKDENEEINLHDVKSMIENSHFSQEELLEAISKLPSGYQVVFNLRVIEGYKHIEIAEALNISESTSKSQLLRARKLLRKNLYELSLTKHSEKRKKKFVYAIAFLGMNDNFNYIDEILKQGFENMNVPPSTEWTSLSAKMNAAKTAADASASGIGASSGITQIGSNIIGYVANHIFTITTFFTAAVVSVGFITSSSELENSYVEHIKQRTELNLLQNTDINKTQESIAYRPNQSEINSINIQDNSESDIDKNSTVVVTVQVPIQKTIHKTQKHIIRDTVKVMKPVFTIKKPVQNK